MEDKVKELSKQYSNDNVLLPYRLDFETIEMYKDRRSRMNKVVKERLKGQMFFVSSVEVPMYEEKKEEHNTHGDEKPVKYQRITQTFRKKDYSGLYGKGVNNEEVGDKNE